MEFGIKKSGVLIQEETSRLKALNYQMDRGNVERCWCFIPKPSLVNWHSTGNPLQQQLNDMNINNTKQVFKKYKQ